MSGDPNDQPGEPVVYQHDAPVVPLTSQGEPTQWMPPAPDSSSVVLAAASVPKRKKSGKLVGAGVGSVAVLLAGAFAVRAITADGGGAESPEAAVQALFDSMADEDMIGAMDAVLPGEQDTFRQPLIDAVAELRRMEVFGEGADPAAIAGIDIEFPEMTMRAMPTNVDDITNVEVSGTAVMSVDGKEIPLGDLVLDNIDGAPDSTSSEETAIEDMMVTTVREDGGWYVSLGYSIAEQARLQEGGDVPELEAAVQPKGGSSPEDGMDVMLDAVQDLDVEGMIAALDPNEFGALHRYAPLFLDDTQRAADDSGIEWTIEDREYTVDENGSTATLTLTAALLKVNASGTEYELEYGDGCVRLSGSEMETQSVCADDVKNGTNEQVVDDFGLPSAEISAFGEKVAEAFADFEGGGITMSEVDGEWFVSPIATGTDTMLAVMRALDRQEIEDIGGAASDVFDAFFSSGSTVSDSGDPGDSGSFDAYYACIEDNDDAVERATCLQDGIDAGTIDEFYVSAQELHPECGLAEYYENGFADYSDLSDTDFTALYESAQSCFEDLVASGDLDEVPMELRDIACYEGINPEAIEDPDEYFDVRGTIFDCLMAAD